MKLVLDAEVIQGTFTLQARCVLEASATGVCGPSGAGKTTFLYAIAGLLRPTRGRIILDDEVLDDVEAGRHVPTHQRRIGLVFQHGHLFPHLRVEGNLRYGERLCRPDLRRIAFDQVVSLCELTPLLQRSPASLSGGERQRVALARALLASPRLLLLDEPLASLDQRLKQQILPYLRRIVDDFGVPMIYVSHDRAELQALGGVSLDIDQGRCVVSLPANS